MKKCSCRGLEKGNHVEELLSGRHRNVMVGQDHSMDTFNIIKDIVEYTTMEQDGP